MKRKLEVDLQELEIALTWRTMESSSYLDLETGQVITVTDEARRTLQSIDDESTRNEERDPVVLLKQRLEQRGYTHEWFQQEVLTADRVRRGLGCQFIVIEPDNPDQDYDDMETFTETVDDPVLRERLWRAIKGKGAFRRFKDLVYNVPGVHERWYAYQDERTKERVLAWLEAHEIEPVT